VLTDIARGGQSLAERLAEGDCEALDPRERGFLHELVLGSLRRRGLLDHAIAPRLDRPLERVDPLVLTILRLGAYQLLHLRVPDRAAVSASVDLAREATPRAAPFVNAVLRKLSGSGAPPLPDRTADPRGWLTSAGSLPGWLAERWLHRLGPETAIARALAASEPPAAVLRLNPRMADAPARCDQAGVRLTPLSVPGAYRADGGRLVDLAREGVLYLQDEGSQLVAHLAAGPGLLLDACAAPGGKSTLAADDDSEPRVAAAEISLRRCRTLQALVRRWGAPRVFPLAADGHHPPFGRSFDGVLIDAPCTGLGTLSRHPDIRWRLKPDDIPRQASRQAALLARLASLVRPGGRLVYATCSLEDEETVGIVGPFLQATPHFTLASPPPWAQAFVDGDGFVRTRPESTGGDGFFAALLRRGLTGL
jgi:16S rRNA (cytosine967-C5)-methyltransferase